MGTSWGFKIDRGRDEWAFLTCQAALRIPHVSQELFCTRHFLS